VARSPFRVEFLVISQAERRHDALAYAQHVRQQVKACEEMNTAFGPIEAEAVPTVPAEKETLPLPLANEPVIMSAACQVTDPAAEREARLAKAVGLVASGVSRKRAGRSCDAADAPIQPRWFRRSCSPPWLGASEEGREHGRWVQEEPWGGSRGPMRK
jgi:hypothetical protein